MFSCRDWIAGASAITLLLACQQGRFMQEPLSVCDEGEPGCDDRISRRPSGSKGGSKGPTDLPTRAPASTQPAEERHAPDTSTEPANEGSGEGAGNGSGAAACLAVTEQCDSDAECCDGLICTQVGGLVKDTCCRPEGAPCEAHADCCGQLLCRPNELGVDSCL